MAKKYEIKKFDPFCAKSATPAMTGPGAKSLELAKNRLFHNFIISFIFRGQARNKEAKFAFFRL